jgi:hypothetical protein
MGGKKVERKDLLEVFRDFEIEVYGRLKVPKYNRTYIQLAKFRKKENSKVITLEDLQRYINNLAIKYPEEGFCLIKEGNFYVITKKAENPKYKPIPIFFDLENQKFYVRREDYEKDMRQTNYVLFRTLGALGILEKVSRRYIGKIEGDKWIIKKIDAYL